MNQKIFIGVIGGGFCSKKVYDLAVEVGREVAKNNGVLVCGGLGGVMEGAACGAKENAGITIGILPTSKRSDANPYIDYPIPTGLGEARNILVVKSSDVVISLPGRYGTLSEMAFCLKIRKPLVNLSDWDLAPEIVKAKNPQEAVKLALSMVE
ncbi:MAG: TIGR00725 family protein [candidate division Zixibacteria bacterium]|nr:TIGR00725 family protein [candidate division Zixibacteria bacterium]